jgi:hypothetical protein
VSGGLLAGYRATWAGDERRAGRPAAGWPWGSKGVDAAGGPCVVRRVPRDLILLVASLAMTAVLDLILDVARDHGAARQGSATRRGWIGPPVGVSRGKS